MTRTLLLGFAAFVSARGAAGPHSNLPLVYFPNYGQEHPAVHYAARSAELTAYFLPSEIVFRLRGSVVRMQFPGATGPLRIEPAQQLPGTLNFLRGREEEWRTGLPMYDGIVYRRLYPGIDMRYGSAGHRLKSEFVVRPGGDPSSIRVRYSGADGLRIDSDGSLVIETAGRELREQPPVVYQKRRGTDIRVEGRFALFGGDVGFILGEYDRSLPLVIDPVITYSTLLGGSGSDAATSLAVDAAGSAYVAGFTASSDFPTANPEQNWNAGGNEVFVAKLNPAGSALVYCTYIGGRADDRAYGIAVDATGAAYVAGATSSANFPLKNALQSRLAGGRNAFVLKLNPAGTGLVYSTYLGGSASDTANGIALDSSRNAYVAGDSTSVNFPTTGLQRSNAGSQDAFVAKLSPDGASLVYSTYLGGSLDDHAAGIAVDAGGTAYVTGSTWSWNFPVASAWQNKLAGGQDAFVARLAANGASLLFSTYLGGSGGNVGATEAGQGIALDAQGNAYVAGVTASADFPVRGAAQSTNHGWQDAFVAKLAPAGTLVYSTYLGGSGIDQANAIAVDATGSAYVAGQTTSVDLAAALGLQNPNPGQYEVFVTRLSSTGSSLVSAVYMGGGDADTAAAITVDGSLNAYIAGWTLSTGFPTLNPIQSINSGNYGAFVAKISFVTPVPSVNGVSPNAGSGTSQTFTFQFSDTAGAGDLTTVSALFNSTLNLANACTVTYNRLTNTLALFTDTGASPGTSITPGSGTQQNSQCVLSGAGSSVTLAGNTLTLKLALTFQPAFAGARNIYSQAVNPQSSTGWQQGGSWTVPAAVTLATGTVTPSSGSGSSQTFTFLFSDTAGATDISTASALVNSTAAAANACLVIFDRAANTLTLLNDAGASPGTAITPGSGTQQNSQCVLSGAGSSVTLAGNTLTLKLALTFQPAFAGARNIYSQVANAQTSTSWQQGGSWTVPGSSVLAPLSAGPSSGSGGSQTFTFVYGDPAGAADIASAWVYITGSFSSSSVNSCIFYYSRATGQLNLENDAATTWSSAAPGGSAILQNSQCSLNVAGASAASSGATLTLSLSLTFSPGFAGTKQVWMYVAGATANSGWKQMGSWTVPSGNPVSAVSVNPASGTGSSQVFQFLYSDANGGADLTILRGYFLSSFSATPSNGCAISYNRTAGQILLYGDDGTTIVTAAVGSGGTLQNSQCSVNVSGTSLSTAGNNVTFQVSVSFKSGGFSGAKQTWLQAVGGAGTSAWTQGGTWTVPPPASATPVSAVSVAPASGTGASQTFTFTFADTSGTGDFSSLWVYFTESFNSNSNNTCILYYDVLGKRLFLENDPATAWFGAPAGAAGILQNSQCSLDTGGVATIAQGNNLALTVPVTFKPGFSGTRQIWMFAAGNAGNSGWQQLGSWTVAAAQQSTPVAAISVAPASSASTAQTFSFNYGDTSGAADLSTVWVYFTSAFSSNSANTCILYYDRVTNRINLENDAASAWTGVPAGSATTLENSQCSLNAAGAAAVAQGNNLTLTVPITFKAGFSGSKQIWMYAAGGAGNSGWQNLGTVAIP